MNWTLLIHDICTAYDGITPAMVSGMTYDEIITLAWDRKQILLATGDRITGTPSELQQMGVLPEGFKRKSIARELMEQRHEAITECKQLMLLEPHRTGRKQRRIQRAIKRLRSRHDLTDEDLK